MGLKFKLKFKKFKKSVKKRIKSVGKVIKKIAKATGIDKAVRWVGGKIKKAFKSFGKFMGKIGVVGQIAMMFILPGIGGALMKGLSAFSQAAIGASNFIVQGVGHLAKFAHTAISTVGNVFSNVTKGVMDTLGNFGKTLGKKMGFDTGGAQNFFGSGDSAFSRSFTNKDVSRFQNLTLGEDAYQKKLLSGMEKINAEAALKASNIQVVESKPDFVKGAPDASQVYGDTVPTIDSTMGMTDQQIIEFNKTAIDGGVTAANPDGSFSLLDQQVVTPEVMEIPVGELGTTGSNPFLDSRGGFEAVSDSVLSPELTMDQKIAQGYAGKGADLLASQQNAGMNLSNQSLLDKAKTGISDFYQDSKAAVGKKVGEGIDFITDPEAIIDKGVELGGDAIGKAVQVYGTTRAQEMALVAEHGEGFRTPVDNSVSNVYRTYIPEFTTATMGQTGAGYADTTNQYESLAYSGQQYGNTAYQLDTGWSSYINRVGQGSQFNASSWG